MTKSFSVLVTDGNAKHSIALQRHLKQSLPGVFVTAHAPDRFAFCRLQRGADKVCRESLETCLLTGDFDMVIPVGGGAVKAVARICPDKAVLPPLATIERCLDKGATAQLAKQLNVPCPRSWVVHDLAESEALPPLFPVVIKPNNETEFKEVGYAHNIAERRAMVKRFFANLPGESNCGLLIQEYVKGVGRGFFTVYDHGKPVTAFMHERLREMPPTGGASTAARAMYDERLKRYSCKLLDALDWHGPAMVEFKYDPTTSEYRLIEINPKFWGSLELGLTAGINFGNILVRMYRGETLSYDDSYNRETTFVWPLDGDLEMLARTGQLSKILEYFQHDVKSNLFQSIRADFLKLLLLLRSLVVERRKWKTS